MISLKEDKMFITTPPDVTERRVVCASDQHKGEGQQSVW